MAQTIVKVGVVGATGYAGAELLRLLVDHPQAGVVAVTSRGNAGTKVSDLFPSLRGRLNIEFTVPAVKQLAQCDVVFFSTPHGVAMAMTPELLKAGVKIVDLSADFRIKDAALWEQWYGMPHSCPELLEQAVYGLPELFRDQVKGASLVANPGCYPTATSLGFAPLLKAGLVNVDSLIADAKSGASGAGRGAVVGTLFGEVAEDFRAYAAAGHRHQPEIAQTLSEMSGVQHDLTFVPHLLPMIRGIEATLYAELLDVGADIDLQKLYEDYYAGEAFVDVMPAGSHPATGTVRGVNQCRIAVHRPQGGKRVVVLSVIDNLIKGASGQAIQNMNLMFGLSENTGLQAAPVWP
jgi:N-acetyl-gamma-glutamyl-phosphate reductase